MLIFTAGVSNNPDLSRIYDDAIRDPDSMTDEDVGKFLCLWQSSITFMRAAISSTEKVILVKIRGTPK